MLFYVGQKVVIASDDRKKNMANCEIALKYLKQSGVPLHDEDGTEIIAEDIVNGDKELVISLLWNMFVHLQVSMQSCTWSINMSVSLSLLIVGLCV